MRGGTVVEKLLRNSERVEAGCLIWLGSCSGKGYGTIWADGRVRSTHIVAYEAWVGPVPVGKELDHLCRNHPCLEPTHLEPVTHHENIRRSPTHNISKTRCPAGHLLAGENLFPSDRLRTNPRRRCRICHRADAARRAAKRAA